MRFNPNLYSNGKVCLSLLGTWSGKGGEATDGDDEPASAVLNKETNHQTSIHNRTAKAFPAINEAEIPFQLPQGGPNYYSFGEKIRYEIHIDNNTATAGDDIVYRFTFTKTNEDPSTFFNIRLGLQNLKTKSHYLLSWRYLCVFLLRILSLLKSITT